MSATCGNRSQFSMQDMLDLERFQGVLKAMVPVGVKAAIFEWLSCIMAFWHSEQAEHRASGLRLCWPEAAVSQTWESAPEKKHCTYNSTVRKSNKMHYAPKKMLWNLVQLSQSSCKQYINTLDKQTIEINPSSELYITMLIWQKQA